MRKTFYESTDYLPVWLEKSEVNDPEEIIGRFFNACPLPESRLFLWQMLKWYGREKDEDEIFLETSDCLLFFERLMSFIEAAHLIHNKTNSDDGRSETGTIGPDICEKITGEINNSPDALAPVINMIKNSMHVEKVFLLGSYIVRPKELGIEYDLLVLVGDAQNRPTDDLESLIHNRSHDMAFVNATVLKLDKVNEMIAGGNYFFSTNCVPGKLIYDSGRVTMEMGTKKDSMPQLNVNSGSYEIMMAKAQGFLSGAENFYKTQEFALAAFMLHQAAEHGLNAFLIPLMQYRVQTHNLHKLMRWIRRFSMEIFDLFPRDVDSEMNLFQVLQKAYIHARYKDTFQVSDAEITMLMERVKLLLTTISDNFKKVIAPHGKRVTGCGEANF